MFDERYDAKNRKKLAHHKSVLSTLGLGLTKVNGKILAALYPQNHEPIDTKICTGDYVGELNPCATGTITHFRPRNTLAYKLSKSLESTAVGVQCRKHHGDLALR